MWELERIHLGMMSSVQSYSRYCEVLYEENSLKKKSLCLLNIDARNTILLGVGSKSCWEEKAFSHETVQLCGLSKKLFIAEGMFALDTLEGNQLQALLAERSTAFPPQSAEPRLWEYPVNSRLKSEVKQWRASFSRWRWPCFPKDRGENISEVGEEMGKSILEWL